MFTGLIEEMGVVTEIRRGDESARIEVAADKVLADLAIGGSISVNGVCLTAIEIHEGGFAADVSWQTLQVTAIGDLNQLDSVNLERPVGFGSAMGGHFVQGHVDGVALLLSRVPGEGWENVSFSIPKSLMEFIIKKGSIAIDGISLTVADLDDSNSSISVALIPETLKATTLGAAKIGARVNVEVDVLGKYVARAVAARLDEPNGN
ncbi:MAG TPA: riboflavin synthase [Candidatus Nanopelagicaceae bacterium]|nr:riboflavin synthase [Candidatus Nanopelagicaceae bacterium]